MDIYAIPPVKEQLSNRGYVGRGIILGESPEGKAVSAYFIMGRSDNSRNRIFSLEDEVLYTKPFDESKVEDPSLIIYAALRRFENKLIVTNGDQTDTIYEGLKAGMGFSQALSQRQFEPDAPNLTPRISGMVSFAQGSFSYQMSILKSADAQGSACSRFTFDYPALPGLGHFIHTYVGDGSPLPTFQGEPERIAIPSDIDQFSEDLWNCLDEENKISLYVRYTDPASGLYEDRLINKNK